MIKAFIGGLQLPVNPLEDVSFSMKANNQRFEIVSIGEVTKIGSRGLIQTEVNSLFTDGDYPFITATRTLPAEQYVQKVRRMFEAGDPVRFILTGDGIDINLQCSLEDFKYEKRFGEWEDYYYTISLMEYRVHSARRIVRRALVAGASVKQSAPREEKKLTPTTHTAVAGDTLWGLAKKYYGDGSQYMKIFNANRTLNPTPNHIYVGQTFVIP